MARALHDRAAGRRLAAHEQRDADHAFVADDGDLGRRAVLHHVEQRDDRRRREVDVAQRAARFVEHLAERQVDRLELRQPALPLGAGSAASRSFAFASETGAMCSLFPQTRAPRALRVDASTVGGRAYSLCALAHRDTDRRRLSTRRHPVEPERPAVGADEDPARPARIDLELQARQPGAGAQLAARLGDDPLHALRPLEHVDEVELRPVGATTCRRGARSRSGSAGRTAGAAARSIRCRRSVARGNSRRSSIRPSPRPQPASRKRPAVGSGKLRPPGRAARPWASERAARRARRRPDRGRPAPPAAPARPMPATRRPRPRAGARAESRRR